MVCLPAGFSGTGTLACPLVPRRDQTGQPRVAVLPRKLPHCTSIVVLERAGRGKYDLRIVLSLET
jgi:hypothetical protein